MFPGMCVRVFGRPVITTRIIKHWVPTYGLLRFLLAPSLGILNFEANLTRLFKEQWSLFFLILCSRGFYPRTWRPRSIVERTDVIPCIDTGMLCDLCSTELHGAQLREKGRGRSERE